jgi:hypothetical protein
LITQPRDVSGKLVPYATFSCNGFFDTELTGNLIGHLESPGCGGSSNELTLNFIAASHGQQQYKQVTTTGPLHDLQTRIGGEPVATTAINGTGGARFSPGISATLACI